MKNLYEILGIEKTATEQEIKKAYNKLLRKYSPEKEPEKYKEIREAYDTLRDSERRKNYDAYFNHGDEIQKLEEEANNLIEKEEYSQAERVLKKILILSPEIIHIRELLGDVFFFQKKYSESIRQYDTLIKEYNNNSDYYYKRGVIYKEKKDYKQAEKDLLKAYSLDFENLSAINSLVYLYINSDKIDKAISFLNKEIYRDNSLDFEDFFSLSKLIECYVLKNDKSGLQKVISDIKKIAPEDEETKKHMSWKLTKLAIDISKLEYYILAYEVVSLAYNLYPDDNVKKVMNNFKLYKLAEELLNDESIEYAPIKGPAFYYMHGDKVKKEDREENLEVMLKALNASNIDFLLKVKKSMKIFKDKYYLLYLEQKELYDTFEKSLDKRISLTREIEEFIDDTRIDQAFKYCILALYENNNQEFKNGINLLGNSNIYNLKNSLSNLYKYPFIKEEYSKFISDIRKIVNSDSRTTNNHSNRSSGYSNNNTNNYSNNRTKKEGCYIATAVYGNYDADEVLVLRKFRDKFLQKYFLGRNFIKLYYAISPTLAKKLKSEYTITKLTKKILDKFVCYLKKKNY